ncbi:MAG: peptidoglycan -binding protein, partial [Alphaproteobacteria bacterium]|nr:peptidoglycan -binding protein [Alphaproteobacteria bacterium]
LLGDVAAREGALAEADARITAFEAQVVALLAERDAAQGRAAALGAELAQTEEARAALASAESALRLALARARSEIDAATEAARLDAARRAALEALLADLRAETEATRAELTETEAARLVEAAAAEALRARLQDADAELTAMTLALEAERQRAEDTLTLMAAAATARDDLEARLAAALIDLEAERAGAIVARTDLEARLAGALEQAVAQTAEANDLRERLAAALAERLRLDEAAHAARTTSDVRNTLLAQARSALAAKEAEGLEAARRLQLLNRQVSELSSQISALQGLLDAAEARDADQQVQIQALGNRLNGALAQLAAEERRRADLEAAERARLEREAAALAAEARTLEAQARELARFRSEFFGLLSRVLADRPGVQVVGDRFVFSSEVLFQPGSADLLPGGMVQIRRIADTLREVAAQIPPQIDWILRIDGHTDNLPLSGGGAFADNWALSQARALSVVRYMQQDLGFPPERMAATGFGEYRPVAEGNTAEARALNRRIELKLTER